MAEETRTPDQLIDEIKAAQRKNTTALCTEHPMSEKEFASILDYLTETYSNFRMSYLKDNTKFYNTILTISI